MSALRRKSQSTTAYFGLWGAADAFSPAHSAAYLDARLLIHAASDRTAAINGPRLTGSPSRMTMTARPLHRVVPGQRLFGDQPATPRQDDPTNTPGTEATQARSLPQA
jgi:hypothetical protein